MYNKNKSCGCGRERCGCNRNEQECQSCRRSTENCCQENYGFDWGDPVPQPEQRQPGCRWPCGNCQPCPKPCPDPQPTECEVQLAECREQLRCCHRRLRACQQELCACLRNECGCDCEQEEDTEPVQPLCDEQDAYPMCEE